MNPREILKYNIQNNKISIIKKDFFKLKESKETERKVVNKLYELVKESVSIRVPDRKFGLLFSGGIDSVIIAKLLQNMGKKFYCYIAATSKDNEELLNAKKIVKELDLKIKIRIIEEKNIDFYLRNVIPLIEDSNVIKAGVGVTIYAACEEAKKDKNKVIFSGMGADELFAGYFRYRNVENLNNLNKDCYSDILKFYEKNAYRDDVITMHNNLELRVPYLDTKVVKYALNINPNLKINEIEKYVLRKVAKKLGLPDYIVNRKKKAAQYGSGVDKLIEKNAKKNNYNSKSAYLDSFLPKKIMKIGALISSGKDSWYAAYILKQQNYDINCLITLESKNKDSYMFHTPNVNLVGMQSKASKIPLIKQQTNGEKEKELQDLKKSLEKAKKKYKIEGICSGAIYSNYQRERIEKVCDSLGLKIFSPLWHMDQEKEMRALIKNKFEFVLSSVAAEGLNKRWLGREIKSDDVDKLVKLNEKTKLNIAGEGGEFESLVLDCPMFTKKIKIVNKEIIEESENVAKMIVKKAKLINK